MQINLYSNEILIKGIEFLQITDIETIRDIFESREYNLQNPELSNQEKIERNKRIMNFDRTKVPPGLTKKELNSLLKETQDLINEWKTRWRRPDNNEITKEFCQAVIDELIIKKGKIKFNKKVNGELNIEKAKQYPIEQLIDFNNAGFAKCINHEDRTPSLKWYPARNKAHCFSCHSDLDSIDIYQKINNVEFNIAVQALC